jgi:hypothetical protein
MENSTSSAVTVVTLGLVVVGAALVVVGAALVVVGTGCVVGAGVVGAGVVGTVLGALVVVGAGRVVGTLVVVGAGLVRVMTAFVVAGDATVGCAGMLDGDVASAGVAGELGVLSIDAMLEATADADADAADDGPGEDAALLLPDAPHALTTAARATPAAMTPTAPVRDELTTTPGDRGTIRRVGPPPVVRAR